MPCFTTTTHMPPYQCELIKCASRCFLSKGSILHGSPRPLFFKLARPPNQPAATTIAINSPLPLPIDSRKFIHNLTGCSKLYPYPQTMFTTAQRFMLQSATEKLTSPSIVIQGFPFRRRMATNYAIYSEFALIYNSVNGLLMPVLSFAPWVICGCPMLNPNHLKILSSSVDKHLPRLR